MARSRRFVVSLVASVTLALGIGAPSAFAQEQDGLVNVIIGDITIQDVNVAVAANIAAGICVQDVNVLAVDQGEGDVVCEIGRGGRQELRITQN